MSARCSRLQRLGTMKGEGTLGVLFVGMISGVIAVLLGGYWGASLLQCIVLYSSVGSCSVLLVSLGQCLTPRFDGVALSLEWKEALWDKCVTQAPHQHQHKQSER